MVAPDGRQVNVQVLLQQYEHAETSIAERYEK